jgi:hypothetical protein
MDVLALFSTQGPGFFWRRIGGKYLLKPTGSILSRLFMGILSFKEEKAYISSLCRMELLGMQRRIPSSICKERGIEVISWPPFSLDLNPIERIWHIIKNYLQDNFPEVMSYDVLQGHGLRRPKRSAFMYEWLGTRRQAEDAFLAAEEIDVPNLVPIRTMALPSVSDLAGRYPYVRRKK